MSVCDIDFGLELRKAHEEGYEEGRRDATQWISVEERLPVCGERVLITEGSAVFEAYLSISHKWVRAGIGWTESVTHWMPLPMPPKEEA